MALAVVQQAERRMNRRSRVVKPVRCRPENPAFAEEVRATLNASRKGLYFTTSAQHYSMCMRLRVTFPYSSVDPYNVEYLGEVVRVDRLGNDRWGVAVKVLAN